MRLANDKRQKRRHLDTYQSVAALTLKGSKGTFFLLLFPFASELIYLERQPLKDVNI